MNGLFCGNSCTWCLLLVIVFLLSQGTNGDCGCSGTGRIGRSGCGCDCGCDDYAYQHNNGCGCGCN